MRQRELKLVSVNRTPMTSNVDNRRRRLAQLQEHAYRRKARRQPGKSGSAFWLSRKQIAVGIVGAVLIAMVGLFCGIWSILSQNLEDRILRKAEQSEPLVNEIARRVEESETLRAAIVNQLRNAGELKTSQTPAEKTPTIK